MVFSHCDDKTTKYIDFFSYEAFTTEHVVVVIVVGEDGPPSQTGGWGAYLHRWTSLT